MTTNFEKIKNMTIEEIVEDFCKACKEFEPEKHKSKNHIYCNYNKILNIINKVKE